MARGRMLNNKIAQSKRVNALGNGNAEASLLFERIISFLDVNGVFFGSAQMVYAACCPRRPKVTVAAVERYLRDMEASVDEYDVPLIIRYKYDGDIFLFCPGFRDEQKGLRRDKENPDYPPPSEEMIRQLFINKPEEITKQLTHFSGKNPEKIRPKDGNNPSEIRNDSVSPARGIEQEQEQEQEKTTTTGGIVLIELFEQNVHQATPLELEEMAQYQGLCRHEWLLYAVKEAVDNNKRNWAYIRAILDHCVNIGGIPPKPKRKRRPPNGTNRQNPGQIPEAGDYETPEQYTKRKLSGK